MEQIIECNNLTHYYGKRLIYENLSFTVPKGRMVFTCHNLLTVAKFSYPPRHLTGLLVGQLKTEFLQVPLDIGVPAGLSQGIFPLPPETLRHKIIAVKIALVVTVGMHSGHLRKHILTDNRLIRSHRNT